MSQTHPTALGFVEGEKRKQKQAPNIFVVGFSRKPARPVRGTCTGQAGSTTASSETGAGSTTANSKTGQADSAVSSDFHFVSFAGVVFFI